VFERGLFRLLPKLRLLRLPFGSKLIEAPLQRFLLFSDNLLLGEAQLELPDLHPQLLFDFLVVV